MTIFNFDQEFYRRNPIDFASPIAAHLEWAAENIYSWVFPNHTARDGIARYRHGAQHVGRVAAYIPMLANLYRGHGDIEALSVLDADTIKLLQIAAIFHDSGREADGEDKWDIDSAINLYHYLIKIKVEQNKAITIAEAMANKDYSGNGKYFKLITRYNSQSIQEQTQFVAKNIYAKLIHDADCLDIIRVRHVHEARYLDFFVDHIARKSIKQSLPALDIVSKLVRETSSLVDSQGDNYRNPQSEIKIKYENNRAALFDRIIYDIENSCVPGTNKALRPLMISLYAKGELLSRDQYNSICYEAVLCDGKDPLRLALAAGTLFARGIRTPAALDDKPKHKLLRLHRYDVRINETLAQLEIRKIIREIGVPTASNHMYKQGNINRSCIQLGLGTTIYCSGGLLVINEDIKNIKSVHLSNQASGYGKKNKEVIIADPAKISNDLKDLVLYTKLGGVAINLNGYIATHHEIALDIPTKTMIVGVYYSHDSNLINYRIARDDGYAMHQYVPILEAIYIQRAYYLKTNQMLPIYEWSFTHNFFQQRMFSEIEIVNMWYAIADAYLKNNLFISDINQLKLNAMYNIVRHNFSYQNAHTALDSNYIDELKNAVNIALSKCVTIHYKQLLNKNLINAGNIIAIKKFLNEGADINVRHGLTKATLLIISSRLIGKTDMVMYLLKRGADPSLHCDEGLTALS